MVVVFICCGNRNSAVTHRCATPAQGAVPLDPLQVAFNGGCGANWFSMEVAVEMAACTGLS